MKHCKRLTSCLTSCEGFIVFHGTTAVRIDMHCSRSHCACRRISPQPFPTPYLVRQYEGNSLTLPLSYRVPNGIVPDELTRFWLLQTLLTGFTKSREARYTVFQ